MMYLTVQQISTRLQVEKETVRRWLRRGELRGIKCGKQWRVKSSKFESFLNKGEAVN